MDFNNIKDILNDVGSTIYEVYIPSLSRNINFRAITVGEQKTFSKSAINNDDPQFIERATIELFKKTCLDSSIDFNNLLDVDKYSILFNFYVNNYPSQLFNFKCSKCDKDYSAEFDVNNIIEKFKTFDCKNKIVEKTFKNKTYKFTTNYNSISDSYNFYNIKSIKKEINELREIQSKDKKEIKSIEEIEDIKISLIMQELTESLLKLCIKSIIIYDSTKNQEINLMGFSLEERIDIINMLPIDLLSGSNGIIQFLVENFYTPLSKLTINTKCTHCGADNEKGISINDFFL